MKCLDYFNRLQMEDTDHFVLFQASEWTPHDNVCIFILCVKWTLGRKSNQYGFGISCFKKKEIIYWKFDVFNDKWERGLNCIKIFSLKIYTLDLMPGCQIQCMTIYFPILRASFKIQCWRFWDQTTFFEIHPCRIWKNHKYFSI